MARSQRLKPSITIPAFTVALLLLLPGSVFAALTLTPTSLDFGGESMLTTSPALTVTITNSDTNPVVVSAVTAPTPPFTVTHNCATVSSGASCVVNVTFTPVVGNTVQSALLTIQSTAGLQTVLMTAIGEASLVTHYYRSILGRAPDAGGKAFWESEATRMRGLGADVNETWYAMATAFYFSPEYAAFNRDDSGFVTDLYQTFFNRAPDAGGLAFWTAQISAGVPREVVLTSFMFSSEFTAFAQSIFGNTAARAEVDTVVDFYRGLLSRLPDSSGFGNWINQFRIAQCNPVSELYSQVQSISSAFSSGPEYLNRNRTNGQYVGDLYNAFLRRGGDVVGVQFWINELQTGSRSRDTVRQNFASSPEFTSRVNAMIAQGCVSGTCPVSVSPINGTNWDYNGGNSNFSVSSPAGCVWNANAGVSWLHVSSGSPGNGDGVVQYSVDQYMGGGTRYGVISIDNFSPSLSVGIQMRQNGPPTSPPPPPSVCNGWSGYTYNYLTGYYCPNAFPYYYPGTHGNYGLGCYASCPYVGDCGSAFTTCP
jgi:hypothetical protein